MSVQEEHATEPFIVELISHVPHFSTKNWRPGGVPAGARKAVALWRKRTRATDRILRISAMRCLAQVCETCLSSLRLLLLARDQSDCFAANRNPAASHAIARARQTAASNQTSISIGAAARLRLAGHRCRPRSGRLRIRAAARTRRSSYGVAAAMPASCATATASVLPAAAPRPDEKARRRSAGRRRRRRRRRRRLRLSAAAAAAGRHRLLPRTGGAGGSGTRVDASGLVAAACSRREPAVQLPQHPAAAVRPLYPHRPCHPRRLPAQS